MKRTIGLLFAKLLASPRRVLLLGSSLAVGIGILGTAMVYTPTASAALPPCAGTNQRPCLQNCSPTAFGFFDIPTWYTYLVEAGRMKANPVTGACELVGSFKFDTDLVLVALAILDMALRVAGLVAAGFVLYGGIKYVISQGEPDKTKEAQQTIINALIGMVIAIISVALVAFVGNTVT